jgi:nitrite reductase/ring-hydroxylating ferredoxin subunit
MTRYPVCYEDELPSGGRKIVDISGRSVGVFRVGEEYYAVRNRCPHKGAPLCKGLTRGLVTSTRVGEYTIEHQGRILACPWHGWEFDLATGGSVFNPHRLRVKRYDVSVDPEPEPEPLYEFASCEDLKDGEDPSIETFPITVEANAPHERKMIYVHVG